MKSIIPQPSVYVTHSKTFLKVTLIWVFALFAGITAKAQESLQISSQQDRLTQYSGIWYSSLHPGTDSLSSFPNIKMISELKLNGQSLGVEVFQNKNGKYESTLFELIAHDATKENIRAFGKNSRGEMFIGEGEFQNSSNWTMQDKDLDGNNTMRVSFSFNSYTDVVVEGFDNANKSLWKTRYIKQNPKDKNIGIQLVSVHKDMQANPQKTLQELSRMGYSYVETFVYDKGLFYGMSPSAFKTLVESTGMRFLGSMTFYNLPDDDNMNQAIKWWKKCIEDHKKAGVKYLSTSNNKIKEIKNKSELKRYTDYYNMIGKLCAENDLEFIFHNHADEFLYVDGVRVYDFFLQNTHPEYVHFQADLYWMKVGGVEPVDYFKKYSNRFISWHIKDYKELGQSGKIDFKEIFKYEEKAGLKYTIAEVEDYNFPPLYSVKLAWEYLYFTLLK